MNLRLTENQKLLRTNTRGFMEKEIAPLADEYERIYGPLPREIAVSLLGKLAKLGYISGVIPREYGGEGLDHLSYAMMLEELSRSWCSLSLMVLLNGTALIAREGTSEHKAKYLAPGLSGNLIASLAMTEPNVGSGIRDIETTASLEGNSYIINGTKCWITGGPICDICFVLASTDRSKGMGGLALFLVDKSESNFTARELPKLGLRACPTGELVFDNCRVPMENLFGGEGAYRFVLGQLPFARSNIGAIAVGLAQAATDAAVNYAQERKQFGKAISRFQMIQETIAEMVVETEAARLITYKACQLFDEGEPCFQESSAAKYFATEVALRVTSKAVDIHGAYGISEEYPVERYFRDARTIFFPDGTAQIQKLVIGREILGVSAFV